MATVGRSGASSALSNTTSTGDARRFDATHHRSGSLDRFGHSAEQRRAAVLVACYVQDREQLAELLEMCGLLPASDSGTG